MHRKKAQGHPAIKCVGTGGPVLCFSAVLTPSLVEAQAIDLLNPEVRNMCMWLVSLGDLCKHFTIPQFFFYHKPASKVRSYHDLSSGFSSWIILCSLPGVPLQQQGQKSRTYGNVFLSQFYVDPWVLPENLLSAWRQLCTLWGSLNITRAYLLSPKNLAFQMMSRLFVSQKAFSHGKNAII